MAEVSRVLREKFRASSEMIEAVTRLLKQDTIFSQPIEPLDLTIRDADDLVILASALAGQANVLVTGDKELLVLGAIQDLEIISAWQFWGKIFGKQGTNKLPINNNNNL